MFSTVFLFGREVALAPDDDLERVAEQVSRPEIQSIFFCNVHMLMLSLEDEQLAMAMGNASVVFADGAPVAWLQRRRVGGKAHVIRGYALMNMLCKRAAEERQKIGLFGSTPVVLQALRQNLTLTYPDIDVALCVSPPFVENELHSSDAEIQSINDLNLKWLFVSLGCPKQEKWIHRHTAQLNCSLLGVGAAFDWLAGTTPKPPGWMEKSGLGWLFRLFQNPRRMWHRYLIYNTKFMLKSATVLIQNPLRKVRKPLKPE